MKKPKDLRDQIYKPFLAWMKEEGIDPDQFDKTAWHILVLFELQDAAKKAMAMRNDSEFLLGNLPIEKLQAALEKRKEKKS